MENDVRKPLNENWRESTDPAVLRSAVKFLKQELEAAHFECRDEACEVLHDDLLAVEWRLRQANRRQP